MISSAAASGIQVPLILSSGDCVKNEAPLTRSLSCQKNVPGASNVIFRQNDLTGLMGALRPQSPALLAAGAFGGNFQMGSFSLSDGNSFLRG